MNVQEFTRAELAAVCRVRVASELRCCGAAARYFSDFKAHATGCLGGLVHGTGKSGLMGLAPTAIMPL